MPPVVIGRRIVYIGKVPLRGDIQWTSEPYTDSFQITSDPNIVYLLVTEYIQRCGNNYIIRTFYIGDRPITVVEGNEGNSPQ